MAEVRYPYLLPNLVAVGLALASILMTLLFLYETKQSEEGENEVDDG